MTSATDGVEPASAPGESARPEKLGGLLLREAARLYFMPAAVTLRIDPMPGRVVRVPGAPAQLLGIATHDGEVLPVVTIGDDRSTMIVCRFAGELMGIVGAKVIGAGLFERADGFDDAISFLGERAETIRLEDIYLALQGGAWSTRWGG